MPATAPSRERPLHNAQQQLQPVKKEVVEVPILQHVLGAPFVPENSDKLAVFYDTIDKLRVEVASLVDQLVDEDQDGHPSMLLYPGPSEHPISGHPTSMATESASLSAQQQQPQLLPLASSPPVLIPPAPPPPPLPPPHSSLSSPLITKSPTPLSSASSISSASRSKLQRRAVPIIPRPLPYASAFRTQQGRANGASPAAHIIQRPVRPSSLPMRCPDCHKVLSSKGNLTRHRRTAHEGVRVHCDICHMSFSQRHDMHRHKKRKHRGKITDQRDRDRSRKDVDKLKAVE